MKTAVELRVFLSFFLSFFLSKTSRCCEEKTGIRTAIKLVNVSWPERDKRLKATPIISSVFLLYWNNLVLRHLNIEVFNTGDLANRNSYLFKCRLLYL